jgi:transposase
MKDIESELYEQIKGHFSCDKRRVKLISSLIVSLVKLTQSSLSKWSKALKGEQSLEAKYKQLQRFARFFAFSPRLYAQVIWQLFGQEKQVYLTLDRTEWKQRGVWIQVLMLGIAHQGMCIPLLWQSANAQGNSPLITKKALIKCFKRWIEPIQGQTVYCLADREFGSKQWFDLLKEAQIRFCIRLKKNALFKTQAQVEKQANTNSKTQRNCLYTLFESQSRLTLKKPIQLYGRWIYVSGQKLASGDYFIVGSLEYRLDLAKLYQNRWQIETLFGAFKSKGFNLESCRINRAKRIKTLLFILAIGLIWAIRTGSWLIEQGKKIPIKRFKNKKEQRWKSVFRWGLDHLQNILLNNLDYQCIINLCPV